MMHYGVYRINKSFGCCRFFKKKVNNNARLQLLPIKNKLEYFAKSGHTAANQESVWPDLAKFRHFGEEKLYFWKFM